MNSEFILDAIRRKHPKAAVVPELSIDDYDLYDTDEPTDKMWMPWSDRPEGWKPIRRIDALMFESLVRTAFEIKVTKEDFKRDTYWKRRMWMKHCHRFIYVVPEYLDVMAPSGTGLWKVDELGKIRVVNNATVSKTPDALPQTVIQRLAYKAAK